MVVVAVAGGAGPVGKAIVDGLVEHGGHTIYVLSRSARDPEDNVSYLQVNYSDVDSTAETLANANIDTFISAIGVFPAEGNEAQKNMVRAASKSSTTRRFILTGYDMLHRREHIDINPIAKHTFEAIEELEKTELEYTRIANGWFLDYFGMPHYKTRLEPWINVINMEKKWAVVPGDGSARATFITTQDMARFVARLLDLKKWPLVCSIVGQEMTLNELVALAEKIRGCKFSITHDDLDTLKAGKISRISEFPDVGLGDKSESLFACVHYLAGTGHFEVPKNNVLNSLFPDIKPTTAEEVMESSWGGK